MEERKTRLLLVDDEPDLVQMVSVRLKAAGYEISTAYDGQEALEKVKESHPDLMILDLMLPKLDGYKVCRLLKLDERTRGIPILIFTARAQVEDVTLATECGADAYLTKPFEAKVLLGKLQELLAAVGKARA
ncbi:MAG: response regulator [Candidatus Omnitrophota bacterium]|nr:response regulator [Candidatus Omnitrophota bacterium]